MWESLHTGAHEDSPLALGPSPASVLKRTRAPGESPLTHTTPSRPALHVC